MLIAAHMFTLHVCKAAQAGSGECRQFGRNQANNRVAGTGMEWQLEEDLGMKGTGGGRTDGNAVSFLGT